ncbi:MAG: TrpB-like pyridoxal phosphate-dependent enzyme [Proteobacteria bacterium]|nr:TrpB-like pyridoxal phosphate-dependent enzyme [Pseudomonadota bacterium]
MSPKKILLSEEQIPRDWYNVLPDLPQPMPPVIHPGTRQPIGPDDLAPIFAMPLIAQEVSQEHWIQIPDEVREVYKIWRPTPLVRADRWERALDTPAHIYFKWEGSSPAGSHKLNTALAQAFYNKIEGQTRLSTETGAGQWGSSLAFACNVYGLDCKVFMVRVSYDQKPHRRTMMQAWGATVAASPSTETKAGRDILARDPNSVGSLGIAISEAVEVALTQPGTKYTLGSVLNHVLLHQTVIGLEAKQQLELAGEAPDVMIGCVGGGSNFGGFALPFVRDKLLHGAKTRFIAVEPTACPSLTKGKYLYDFGDTACTTPLMKMYTLGHNFMPESIHAGGLRYHGMAPLVCHLYDLGVIEAQAVAQTGVFAAALSFARAEGLIPAPEPSHAIKVAMDEALRCKATGERKVIVFNLCGHGHFDMAAYEHYLTGRLRDHEHPEHAIDEALKDLPGLQPSPG